MTWVRVLTQRDLDELRILLAKGDKKRAEWEYKLYRDNIIISVPVIPWNPKTRKPDPSMRYMAKFLRVVPTPGGPFQLDRIGICICSVCRCWWVRLTGHRAAS